MLLSLAVGCISPAKDGMQLADEGWFAKIERKTGTHEKAPAQEAELRKHIMDRRNQPSLWL